MSTDPAAERPWVVEPYRPGDEEAIRDLFVREFGVQRTAEHWRWKFLQNPYGGPFISLAWHRNPRFLVGNQVLMPIPLNIDGRKCLAGHSLDLVVHRDFRRQGVFEHTGRHAEETLRRAGGVALVAFPNASSYPGFVRTLGWKRILEPERWTLRLGIRRQVQTKLRVSAVAALADALYRPLSTARLGRALARARAATPAHSVTHSASVPEDVDALWAREARVATLSLWKDRTYLSWRYEQHPEHRFVFHSLSHGSERVGLCVTVVRDGVALVCEFMVPGRDPAVGRRLLMECCDHRAREGVDRIQYLGSGPEGLAEVFGDFVRLPAPENVFVGRAIDDDALTARMADAKLWTLAYGDGDFV